MVTEFDERKGLVKTYWSDVRVRAAKAEPTFAKIVDDLNPDKTFPLYLAYYPYGSLDGDTESSFFPTSNGRFYRLSDACAPKDVLKHLGYSVNHTPFAMVLEKELEYFIDLKDESITIPWLVYAPGKIFPFSRILNKKSHRIYEPNGILASTAGARSIFMLPNIGSATNHSNLQRDFNVKSPPPKSLYEHWHVFKEIINSPEIDSDWRCCILYFAEKWLTKIHTDKSWVALKQYLYEIAWDQFEYQRTRVYYDIAFSMIKKKRNLKPNPYLADTAMHLFTTALGVAPGYAPALDDKACPIDIIQKAFVESYGLKKYFPTIMQPTHFYFEQNSPQIYYSLQNPSTYVFSPKSREVSSTLFEIRELEHIMKIFSEELSKENEICSDTILNKIAKNVSFNYFHNKIDRHRVVRPSTDIIKFDKRFNMINPKYKKTDATFASDAPFIRGCISINSNN